MKPVDIAAEFQKLNDAIRERANQVREEEKAKIARQQLSLPGGETISDSGAETRVEAEDRTS